MRLSEIFSQTKQIEVAVGDDALAVTYRPQAVTPELVDRMNNAGAAPGEAIAKTVVELVADWDLTGEDGKVYPINLEMVRKLPISFLGVITKAITEDINPNAARRSSSDDTSSMTGN